MSIFLSQKLETSAYILRFIENTVPWCSIMIQMILQPAYSEMSTISAGSKYLLKHKELIAGFA